MVVATVIHAGLVTQVDAFDAFAGVESAPVIGAAFVDALLHELDFRIARLRHVNPVSPCLCGALSPPLMKLEGFASGELLEKTHHVFPFARLLEAGHVVAHLVPEAVHADRAHADAGLETLPVVTAEVALLIDAHEFGRIFGDVKNHCGGQEYPGMRVLIPPGLSRHS